MCSCFRRGRGLLPNRGRGNDSLGDMTHTKWQGALFAARGNPTPSFANDPLSQSSTAALPGVLFRTWRR